MSRRKLLVPIALLVFSVAGAVSPAFAGGGGHGCREAPLEAASSDMSVEMVGNCFQAAVSHVDVGTTVTWQNLDGWDHAIGAVGADWGSEPLIPAAGTFSHRFDEAGAYPYYCVLHPGMVGTVIVEGATGPSAPAVASVGVAGARPDIIWLILGLVAGIAVSGAAALARVRR